jgi:glucan biosynthesis protein C
MGAARCGPAQTARMNRRHDIDALRALAFLLVIVYHVGMYYVAGWSWHLKSPHSAEWLQWPMRAVNLWRMDLVFLISGLALGFLARGGGGARLLAQRSWRLLLPLAFGMAVIVPYQPYAQMVAAGVIEPGFGAFLLRYAAGGPWPPGSFEGWEVGVTWNHLWYLPYLWTYTAVLLAMRGWLDRVGPAFRALRGARLALVPVLPLALATVTLWPHFPPTHDLIHDGWLHAVYFTLFAYGWWIGTDEGWWAEVRRLRWPLLALALAMLAGVAALRAQLPMPPGGPPRMLVRLASDLYLWWALLAILGWAHQTLNRPWPWLAWANEQVYPWYLLHQTITIVLITWLAPLRLGPVAEPALLLAGTIAGCWLLTSIRRVDVLRPWVGLKRRGAPRCPSPASPACPGAHNA